MINQDIGYLLKRITDKMKIYADADFKKRNLTFSQANVLGFIHSQGGKTTQKEIELHLNVTHPTVVGIVSRLEGNGYLNCWMDTKDRRNKIVCMTEKAMAIADEMYTEMRLHEQHLLRSLSAKEIAELSRMLQIMYKNIE